MAGTNHPVIHLACDLMATLNEPLKAAEK